MAEKRSGLDERRAGGHLWRRAGTHRGNYSAPSGLINCGGHALRGFKICYFNCFYAVRDFLLFINSPAVITGIKAVL